MRLSSSMVLSLALVVTGGCAGQETPPAATGAPAQQTALAPPAAVTQAGNDKDPGKATIAISDRIRAACGIDRADAYFAYNSAHIKPRARDLLKKVAECFTDGPLSGEAMRLVGHADPRGEAEYNLALGGRRADSVKSALTNAGLAEGRVSTTSRGEMDATGTSEQGWAQDRRVDMLLADRS